jgi:hypothetical protein
MNRIVWQLLFGLLLVSLPACARAEAPSTGGAVKGDDAKRHEAAQKDADSRKDDEAKKDDDEKAEETHPRGETHCVMHFSLSGWSAFYKTSSGHGTITCDNGEKAKVRISSKGGGFTFGKSKISDGTGKFSPVDSIDELFGAYAQGEAHAGAGRQSGAGALTKGDVSLALAGLGHGVEVGVSFGRFEIERE